MCVPVAVCLAAGGGLIPGAKNTDLTVADDISSRGIEVVAGPSNANWSTAAIATPEHLQLAAASRWRVAERAPQILQAGVAPESGLQVKTILAARAISAAFPEILNIGGVRPDALRWHPDGLALDVMIANYNTAEGIALGNQIVAFALKNAERFALQDCIWRGTYYTPSGSRSGGYGHYDHVHITTKGGGYPTGAEVYFR